MQDKSIKFDFEVLELEPEFLGATVITNQILAFQIDVNTIKVFAYFMENNAYSITGGFVDSAMGKVHLYYSGESPSGAMTASISLRKICYTFTEAQGMARDFLFRGKKYA